MRSIVVVPCWNEEKRLRPDGFLPLLRDGGEVTFVDNGSTDGTAALIARFCEAQPRAHLLSLPGGGGKAETVRLGMRDAMVRGAEVVGFLDADLATPAEEMLRVLQPLADGSADVSIGVRLPGPGIERKPVRRVLGAVFATCAAATLGIKVRDTQCGAKAFRTGLPLERALSTPFAGRWAFDVELIGRLRAAGVPMARLAQVPLREWRDVAGSRLRPSDFLRMGLELVRIRAALKSLPPGDFPFG